MLPLSPKRLAANRANSKLSTGPRTEAGKRRSSQNSFRHGLCSRLYIFNYKSDEAYENHCRMIRESLAPVTALEQERAQSIADDFWRYKGARGRKARLAAFPKVTTLDGIPSPPPKAIQH